MFQVPLHPWSITCPSSRVLNSCFQILQIQCSSFSSCMSSSERNKLNLDSSLKNEFKKPCDLLMHSLEINHFFLLTSLMLDFLHVLVCIPASCKYFFTVLGVTNIFGKCLTATKGDFLISLTIPFIIMSWNNFGCPEWGLFSVVPVSFLFHHFEQFCMILFHCFSNFTVWISLQLCIS